MAFKKTTGDYLLQKEITEGTTATICDYPDDVSEYMPSALKNISMEG